MWKFNITLKIHEWKYSTGKSMPQIGSVPIISNLTAGDVIKKYRRISNLNTARKIYVGYVWLLQKKAFWSKFSNITKN